MKQLFGRLLVRYPVYRQGRTDIGRSFRLWQINQISDSSQPSNCIMSANKIKLDLNAEHYFNLKTTKTRYLKIRNLQV